MPFYLCVCICVHTRNCFTQRHSAVKVLLLVGHIKLIFVFCFNSCILLTGGNQRDLARAKNQKKLQDEKRKKGGTEAGAMTLEQRKQR